MYSPVSASSATIAEMLKQGLEAATTNGDRQNGDAIKAIAEAPKKLEATYSTPFLAHAPMEMMNCTVKVSADRADAWVPTQNLEAALAALSEVSGVPLASCEIHRHDLGGGFGRRGGTQDYVHQATEIAKSFPDTPIKLIWTREEDQAHDFYRPISQCKLSAGLDNDGNLVGLHVRISGQSINARVNPNAIVGGKDMRQLQGLYETPGDAQLGYDVPNLDDILVGEPVRRLWQLGLATPCGPADRQRILAAETVTSRANEIAAEALDAAQLFAHQLGRGESS